MSRVRHVKKGDTIVMLSGAFAGKTGKILDVWQVKQMVQVEGIGITKRHTKPSQTSPKGGVIEGLRWWPASKVQASTESGKGLGRSGYNVVGSEKTRVYSKARAKK